MLQNTKAFGLLGKLTLIPVYLGENKCDNITPQKNIVISQNLLYPHEVFQSAGTFISSNDSEQQIVQV